jgi:hypothetical protein
MHGTNRRSEGNKGVAAPICELPAAIVPRAAKRLSEMTAAEGDCVVWTGRKSSSGYGVFHVVIDGQKRTTSSHRASWILAHGPIGDPNLVIDHLCRNRACCKPEHLDLVDSRTNSLRGAGTSAARPSLGLPEVIHQPSRHKERCIRGHLMDADNTYFRLQRGKHRAHVCRTCALEGHRIEQPTSNGHQVGDAVSEKHNPFGVAVGQKWMTPDKRVMVVTSVQWDLVRKHLVPAAGTVSTRTNRASLAAFRFYKRIDESAANGNADTQ